MRPVLLPERLKTARKKMGLEQKDIARMIGVSDAAYSYYEKGERAPGMPAIERMAQELRTSSAYLTGRTDNMQPDSITIRDSKLVPLLTKIISGEMPVNEETLSRIRIYLEMLSKNN